MNSSPTEIRRYVNDKYVKRLYSKPGEEDPLTRLKSGSYTVEKEVKPEKDVGPKKK